MLENTEGQSKMDNSEKLATRRKTCSNICVRHHYTQANTNNVNNKTYAILKTIGGKDVFMQKSQWTFHHGTKLVRFILQTIQSIAVKRGLFRSSCINDSYLTTNRSVSEGVYIKYSLVT
jgi:hypothetical protein